MALNTCSTTAPVGSPTTLSQIDSPSAHVAAWEVGANGSNYSDTAYVNTNEWFWVSTVNSTTPQQYDLMYGDCDNAAGNQTYYGGCPWYPRYRHGGNANFLYLDGHVKSKPKGQLNYKNDIYDVGLDGSLETLY